MHDYLRYVLTALFLSLMIGAQAIGTGVYRTAITLKNGTQEIFSAVFGLAISCGIFYLANNIKRNA